MANTTENFELFNYADTKNIAVVVTIEDVPYKFANRAIFTKVKYGDEGIKYGDTGLVYGALRRVDDVEENLTLGKSSLTIQQRCEPEQGRSSVSVISMAFLDENELMTQIISPGIVIDEILGKKVKVELGYQEISYPSDYFVIFRGIVTAVQALPGVITMQFSDPNVRRRQQIFYSAVTTLTSAISDVATTLPVAATGDFHQQILGPDGSYDSAIKTYVKIEDEFIEYPSTGIASPTSFSGVTRGARGTSNVAHDIGSDVTAYIEIQDHAIDCALKIMLSGWNGPWTSGESLQAFVETSFPGIGSVANAIVFPEGVDVVKDYGLTVGDYVTTTGASNGANNVTLRQITSINDFDDDNLNRYIVVDGASLTTELSTSATIAFRSQYDTYPTTCGLKLETPEVDVVGHLEVKDTYLSDSENSYRFFLNGQRDGKSFLESEVYLPVSAYSLTRNGQLSCKMTKPPLASAELVTLSSENILNAENLRPIRAVNSRTFFNEIVNQFDTNDAGEFTNSFRFIDTTSLSLIGISSTLAINSIGLKSDLATDMSLLLTRRANFLLSRYRQGAVQFDIVTNFGVGNQIEPGDTIILDGNGLSISNFVTGSRDLGQVLFEVTNRKLNLSTGQTTMTLVAGLGADITDRFATVSPSSLLDSGSTTTQLVIKESFTEDDPKFPGNEPEKWINYTGQLVAVHNEDFTFYEEVTFESFDATNGYKLNISPALSVAPPADYILDISRYPTSTDPTIGSLFKQSHLHISPTVLVASGLSGTSFTVAVGDASKFLEGAAVRVHNNDFSDDSGDKIIASVAGITITLTTDMGFTPGVGYRIDLIGFPDSGGAYRWI